MWHPARCWPSQDDPGHRPVAGVRVPAEFVRLEHRVRHPRPPVPLLRHEIFADVGTAITSLQVRGALAPGAYVSWRAQSVKPQVSFDTTSGQWKYGGDAHVQRRSKWHRTDAPCQAASKGSKGADTNRSTRTRCPSRSRSSISSGRSYATTASSAGQRVRTRDSDALPTGHSPEESGFAYLSVFQQSPCGAGALAAPPNF